MIYKLTTHNRFKSSYVQYLETMGEVLHELRTLRYDSANVSKIDNTGIKCAYVRYVTIINIERGNKHGKKN